MMRLTAWKTTARDLTSGRTRRASETIGVRASSGGGGSTTSVVANEHGIVLTAEDYRRVRPESESSNLGAQLSYASFRNPELWHIDPATALPLPAAKEKGAPLHRLADVLDRERVIAEGTLLSVEREGCGREESKRSRWRDEARARRRGRFGDAIVGELVGVRGRMALREERVDVEDEDVTIQNGHWMRTCPRRSRAFSLLGRSHGRLSPLQRDS